MNPKFQRRSNYRRGYIAPYHQKTGMSDPKDITFLQILVSAPLYQENHFLITFRETNSKAHADLGSLSGYLRPSHPAPHPILNSSSKLHHLTSFPPPGSQSPITLSFRFCSLSCLPLLAPSPLSFSLSFLCPHFLSLTLLLLPHPSSLGLVF